jgi:hypothetical protein
MASIYLSYRRQDSALTTGRIYDRLVLRFGRKNVFKDVDNIPAGVDFWGWIDEAVSHSDALLVVIGPDWLHVRDAGGRRRLDDLGDFVRIEIETALRHQIPIIPVLVQGAEMPRMDELPPGLRALGQINALPLRDDPDFARDMARLEQAIVTLIADQRGRERHAAPEAVQQAASAAPYSRAALSPLLSTLNIVLLVIGVVSVLFTAAALVTSRGSGTTIVRYNRQAIAADQLAVAPTPTATLTPALASAPTATPAITTSQTGLPLYQAVNYPTSIRVGSYDTVRLMLSVSQGTLKVIISNVDTLQHKVVETYLPLVSDLSAYKDVGFIAETTPGDNAPLVWELTTLDRQSFLADRTQSAEARYLDQLFFEWRVNAMHEGQNQTAISLKMYLTNLNGTSETTLPIGEPLQLAIAATQESQVTPTGQNTPSTTWWPPTWIPSAWWPYIGGVIAILLGGLGVLIYLDNVLEAAGRFRTRLSALTRGRQRRSAQDAQARDKETRVPPANRDKPS